MLSKSFPTKDEILKARNADLIEFIRRCGEEVVKCGPQEHCLTRHDSLKISHNKWCWHARDRIGGSCIDFAMHYPEKFTRCFSDAVGYVLDVMYGREINSQNSLYQVTVPDSLHDKDLTLPKSYFNNNRVIAYLNKTRGIDIEIISILIRNKKLYESWEGHNCVFVGHDKEGTPRYGFLRGTFSEVKYARDCPGSSKDYGFVMEGVNDKLYVFESPIDAMSHSTMFKFIDKPYFQDHRISLGGVSGVSLFRYLEDHPDIKNVVLCLDKDKAGEEATIRIRNQLSKIFKDRDLHVDSSPPKNKDYNEDLLIFFDRQIQNGRMI